ncbi:D-alanyl-D-alanine carboxypeptidase [Streptomyces sp. NPDC018955]|uniref:D-alanyl-D-alanine carboxypeptidase n=1 Tax=Streptomyces sp. NPDC018955 TaxID=3365055 RepID=UPI00378F3775
MAGESPDRSKQRESSEGTTSGSGGPVPGKRDPRLAVSRGAEPAEGSGAVDTATRVLSTRDGAPADGDGESGRLREAVATWARPADPDEDGAEDATGGPEDASGSGTGASEAGSTSGAGTGTSGTGTGTSGVSTGVDVPESGTNEPESGGSGARDGSGTEPEPGRADASDEDIAGRTTAAAEPEDEAAEAPEDATDASHGQGGPEGAGSGTPAVTAEAPRDEEEPEKAGTDTDAPTTDASAGDTPRAKDGAEDAADAGADTNTPKAGASTGSDTHRPEEGPESAGTDTDAPTADASAGDAPRGKDAAQGVPAAGAAKDVAPGGEGRGTGSSEGDGGKPADDASTDEDDDEDEPGDGPAADDAPEADTAGGGPKAEGPVDQPTAVFRTGRPSAPAVDQPTTMLKLGGAGRGAAAEAEAESERTSKFVALKRDEDLGGRKPSAAPAAPTAALPQVGPERTTQQPLPPRPPLDLLAELTNTPPPPQTPLRTAVRRVKIWAPLVVLLVIVFAIVQAVRPLPTPTLVLTAEDTHTFDGDQVKLPWPGEGQGWMSGDGIGTMDHFGEQEPVAIGSVAKTMTAYIILREHPLKPGEEGPKIEVDAKAEKEGGYDKAGESTLNTVKAGDSLTEKQALSAVMIPSANNIARLLARWDAGSEEAFVKKMNDTAKELGMTDTTYTDPSGLKETTVSTAEDQTKLGIAAMRNPAMVAITSAASWTDPSGQYWSNYNELPYTMGAIGIKTGSTTKAGGNLLFAARKKVGGREITVVGAILGQHKGPSILDTVNDVSKPALRAAQDALTSTEILKKGTVVGYVDDGLGGRTPVAVTEDVKAVGWAGLEVKLTFAAEELPHTAGAGTKVGTLTVGDGTNGAVKVPVALQEDLVEPGFTDKLTRLG